MEDELKKELTAGGFVLSEVDDSERKELGRGSYGVVSTVRLKGKKLAAKSFHNTLTLFTETDRNKTLRAFIDECRRSLSLKHDNIVVCHGIYYPQDSSLPSLVMEYLPYCLGRASIGGIPLQFKPFILADVAKGLYYLHSNNVMHRDLTANNVLLTMSLKAKISDFGQAKMVQPEQLHCHTAAPGNSIYMPPEAKLGKNYDFSLDVFSFGVLILHTYLERVPQPIDETVRDPYDAHILHQRAPLDYFAHELDMCVNQKNIYKSLVCRCLEEDPSRRPSTEELLTETSDIIYYSLESNSLEIVKNLQSYCAEAEEKLRIHEKNEKALQEAIVKVKEETNQKLLDLSNHQITNPVNFQISTVKEKYENDLHNQEALNNDLHEVFAFDDEEDVLKSMQHFVDYDGQCNNNLISLAEEDKQEEYASTDELFKEIEKLKADNQVLEDKLRRLQSSDQSFKSSLSSYSSLQQPGNSTNIYPPPLTIYGKEEQRMLLEDNCIITIENVPQEPSSFADIKGAQAVYLQGKVYLGRVTPSIWVYDTETNKWEKLAQDAPVKNYALVIYQEELVLLGGSPYEGKISSEVLVFRNNEWSSQVIPKMNESRANATAVGSGIYLVAMGGSSTKFVGFMLATLSSVEVYNSIGKKWARASSLPRPGHMMQCFNQDGYLYLLNPDGWTARYCIFADLIATSQTGRKSKVWKSLHKDLPHTRSCVFVYEDTLLAISGAGSDGALYAYDPSKGRNPSHGHWKKLSCSAPLPAIKNATCLLVGHKKLFLCGGNIDMFTDLCKASFYLRIDEESV